MNATAFLVIGIVLIVLGWFVQSNIFEAILDVMGIIIIVIGVIVVVIAGINALTGRKRGSSGF